MENMDERKIPYMHRDHALFICFAPCDNPEIAVSVVVEHGGHGGTQAALVARDVINWYFGDKQKINNIEAKSQ
jgi:penicillin-binding protein 2